MGKRRGKIPPQRDCTECPRTYRAWNGIRCPDCARRLEENPPEESFSQWRERLKREGLL